MTRIIHLYTDGACRGNPGPGGAGAVVVVKDKEDTNLSYFVGEKVTNNIAEYTAVVMGVEFLKNQGVEEDDRIVIYTDSNLIVQQMNGAWKVKNEKLKPLFERAMKVLQRLNVAWSIKWVKGHAGNKYNEAADKLANLAIDKWKEEK